MIALDTSFLLDYLDGTEATGDYLKSNADKPFFIPSLSLFEVYRGTVRTDIPIEKVISGLSWAESLPLTEPAAREAAIVEAELLDAGTPINLGDILIAGICRANGATIVSRDKHFRQIPGLQFDTY